jgi:GNAT superfamily N-acetyltransferase
MHIGFATEEQLESITDLLHDMSLHYNGANASTRDAVKANLVDNILGPDSSVRLVTAWLREQVVGLAAVALLYPAPKERGQMFMKELYVLSSHRGQGIGQALMRWIAADAVRKNCCRLDWTAERDNEGAVAFYQNLGATHVAQKMYFRLADDDLLHFANGNVPA